MSKGKSKWDAGIYCSTYCNKGHRLSDGKPVAHECVVLPIVVLEKERAGDFAGAIAELEQTRLYLHRGLRAPKA